MEKIRIGVDLGTTNTLACYMKGSKPDIIKFPGSGNMLPSILYLEEDGSVLVGERARKKGVYDPLNCIRSSKTEMGNFEKVWKLRGRKFTPTDVATEILKEVKKGVIKKIKAESDTQIEAVITVPAYFTSNQIDETRKAGERAGLTVLGIVTEPRAAAIANIKELGIEEQKIFVVDLGGGTFDISILEANRMQYNTLAVDGDRRLGGDDFDKKLFGYIRKYIEEDLGIDLSSQKESGLSYNEYYSMIGRIQEAACEAKRELSDEEEYEVNIPNLFPYKNQNYSLELMITREKFHELCAEIFEKVKRRIYKVFQETDGLEIEDIDSVILAGGSCYIPKIKEDVEKIFEKSADTTMDRSTMVVVGACFIADTWDDLSGGEGDIISHSLGVEILRQDGKLVLSKLLKRGEVYPCSRKKMFTTTFDNQESVAITIYEAGSDKEDVEEIESIGKNNQRKIVHDLYGSFELEGIQKALKGVPQIEVIFEYDRSRLLTVMAEDKITGAKKKIVVTKGMRAAVTPHVEPVDFELLVDTSGSMSGMPIRQAKQASIQLIKEIIDLNVHRLGIIGFGQKVTECSPLTQDRNRLIMDIDSLDTFGGTRMADAISMGIKVLSGSKRRRVLMIVTDGAPNNRTATSRAAQSAVENGIDIITIAAGSGADQDYLATLASQKDYSFSIQNMSQLSEMFETAVAQYLAAVQ